MVSLQMLFVDKMQAIHYADHAAGCHGEQVGAKLWLIRRTQWEALACCFFASGTLIVSFLSTICQRPHKPCTLLASTSEVATRVVASWHYCKWHHDYLLVMASNLEASFVDD